MTGRRPELDRITRRYFIYRLTANDGTCLYVGRSCQPIARLREHHRTTPWAKCVVQVEAWGPYNWREACDAERAKICDSKPAHNREFVTQHVGRGSPVA